MGFLDDAWKAMDGFGQEAVKHVGPLATEVWKHVDNLGQEAVKHAAPVAAETWKRLDGFGQEAGKAIGPVAGEAWKQMDTFGQKHVVPAAVRTKDWIEEHPGETVGIVASVIAAPVTVGVVGKALRIFGFGRAGITAMSAAAAYQAGVGNVAAGGTFAIMQSAGAGGEGAAIVNSIAAGMATAAAVAATIPGLVKAATKDKEATADEDTSLEFTEEEREKHLIELQDTERQTFAIGEEDEIVDAQEKKEQ
ncbi:hypothetical protein EJ02DRAFT_265314 [Clathrospora elynae]|uniref:Uncharacterized protein n=1 Tax=Clathrospora elynae TaxID=706981 RepID=A0A6A5SPN4_9PLEO|nr:hypothetical protein EJ02DRAFT_265314 [Clathrospora elynae]